MNRKDHKEEELPSHSHAGRKSTRFSSVAKSLIMLKKSHGNVTPDEPPVSTSSRPSSTTHSKSSTTAPKASGKISVNDYLALYPKKKSISGSVNAGRVSATR